MVDKVLKGQLSKNRMRLNETLRRYIYIACFSLFFVIMAPADIIYVLLEDNVPGVLWNLRYALMAAVIVVYAVKGERSLFYTLACTYGVLSLLTMIFGDAPLMWGVRVAFPYVTTMLLVGVFWRERSEELLWGMLIVLSAYSLANTVELIIETVSRPETFGRISYTQIAYRNSFSRIYIPAIVASVLLDVRKGRRFSLRSLILAIAAIIQSCLAFSATSAVELVFVVIGLLLVQSVVVRRAMNGAVFGIGYLVFFLLFVVFRVQAVFSALIEGLLHKSLDFTGRTDLWDQAIDAVFPDHVLFGCPKGGSPLLSLGNEVFWTAHNGILDIMLWGGALSLLVFMALVVIVCIGLYRCRTDYSASLYSLVLGAFLIGALMESFVFVQSVFFLAMAYSYTRDCKEASKWGRARHARTTNALGEHDIRKSAGGVH